MKLRTIAELKKLEGTRVLLRVDFNIPLGPKGKIGPAEDIKLRAALPTIERLLAHGAKVIAVSHLGRPEKCEAKYSLKPVAKHLEKLLHRSVMFVDDCLNDGDKVDKKLAKLEAGHLALLENIRYYEEEEKNDAKFAKRLSKLADIFVSDAFATAHRAHASTAGVAKFLPSYAGLLVEKEVKSLDRLLKSPKHSFVVLLGGAKISSKLPTLKKLLTVADKVMIGGGMANAFNAAKGWSVGKSKVAPEEIKLAKKLLSNKKLVFPVDVLVASALTDKAKVRVAAPNDVKANEFVPDIGPKSVMEFAMLIRRAKTIAWNGPMGMFEVPKFSHATLALGRLIAAKSRGAAFGVVGGGETLAALEATGMGQYVDHVSTGGGAMLEYLSGQVLPGVKVLMK